MENGNYGKEKGQYKLAQMEIPELFLTAKFEPFFFQNKVREFLKKFVFYIYPYQRL